MENDKLDRMAFGLCVAMMVAWLCFMLCSCTTQYVPVETVRHDSVFFAKIQKDSIFVRDSVHIKEKGDTVFVDKYKYVYRNIVRVDTFLVVRTDSIQVPIPVEKKRTCWEQTKIDIAGTVVCLVSLVILYLLVRWIFQKSIKK